MDAMSHATNLLDVVPRCFSSFAFQDELLQQRGNNVQQCAQAQLHFTLCTSFIQHLKAQPHAVMQQLVVDRNAGKAYLLTLNASQKSEQQR